MRLFAVLTLAILPALANADAARDLSGRLAELSALSGSFEQLQYNQQGNLSGETSGRFRLLVPGYFAWDIQSPDSQLLIADPEYLWHYDRDLETVTRRPVSGPDRATPLQVLGGTPEQLQEQFEISAGDVPDSFRLVPLAQGQGFQSLTLTFTGNELQAMEVIDSLNQRVAIRFDEIESTALRPEDFAFTPPEGADLFIYEE